MQLVHNWAALRPAFARPAAGRPGRSPGFRFVTRASGGTQGNEGEQQQFGLPSLPSMMQKGPGGQQVTPSRLVSGISMDSSTVEDPRPLTVYTLRLSTGWRSGAAQLDTNAGVQVALVAQDGTTLLHRVGPINDPAEREIELRQMCEVIATQPGVGANCPAALDSARKRNAGKQAITQRFQEGSVDEVCFLGPELGPLAGVLIGPEAGRWLIDEVAVSSSRSHHSDRFVCRELLGEKGVRPAAWLTPVPEDAVVYGSGEQAMILTKDQAAAMRSLGLAEYQQLKGKLLSSTAALVAGGTALAFLLAGLPLAAPFAGGGLMGLAYQYMLAAGVDSLPSPDGGVDSQADAEGQASSPMSNGPVRLMSLFGFGCALWLAQQALLEGTLGADAAAEVPEFPRLVAVLAGFLMYKVAVVGVTVGPLAPGELHQPTPHK